MGSRAFLAVALLVAALASGAWAAVPEDVSLNLNRAIDPVTKTERVTFSGTISSDAGAELVTVMYQKCGTTFSTSVAAAQTLEGGTWSASPTMPISSGTFRARWKNDQSEPVRYRAPARVYFSKQRGREFRVSVVADTILNQRFVSLQRLAGGRWVHVRRITLELDGAYSAEFKVQKRGLRLRIFVPAKTAAPCYASAVSQTVRS